MTDFHDPVFRAQLIEAVGPAEYSRRFQAYLDSNKIAAVNGHEIHPCLTRFGKLFAVGNTGKAFDSLEKARAFAAKTPAV